MYKCSYCLKEFGASHTMYRHRKKCIYKNSPKIKLKEPVVKKRKETSSVSDSALTSNILSAIADMNAKMEAKIDGVSQKLHQLENKPYQINNNIKNINNINNSNINNIVITEKLPECFFSALITKLGKTKAINLLNLSSASNSAINIYKELYPSKKMKDNPVIYENNTFKYLNGNKVISDDKIIIEIAKQIQTAMLYASSNLITESIKINKTHQLYDIYDIGKIQSNVRDTNLIEKQVSGYIKLELIN